jgi:hypothetical protein
MTIDTSLPIQVTITDENGNARPDALGYCILLNTSDTNSDGEPDDIDGIEKVITKRADSNGVVEFTSSNLPITYLKGTTPEEKYAVIDAKAIDDGSGEPLGNSRFPVLNASNEPAASDYIVAYQLEETLTKIHNYPLDDNTEKPAQDNEGTNDLKFNGPAYKSDSQYVGGYAVDFDGADDLLRSQNEIPEINTNNSWAIFATVNANDNSRGSIVSNRESGTNLTAEVAIDDANNLSYQLYDGSSYVASALGISVQTGKNYRIVATFDGSSPALYINDSEITATAPNVNLPINETDTFLVGGETDNGFYFDGVVDNVIIMDELPSRQAITDDYNDQPWS